MSLSSWNSRKLIDTTRDCVLAIRYDVNLSMPCGVNLDCLSSVGCLLKISTVEHPDRRDPDLALNLRALEVRTKFEGEAK